MASQEPQYDVIVVGAGFGGCYILNELRNEGFKTLLLEEAPDLGGVWYWNTYNGARTDTRVPLYEFSDESIWSDWNWTEKFPGVEEIQRYFQHVDSKLHLKKDIRFNSRVEKLHYDEQKGVWNVSAKSDTFETRFVVLATGFAAKPLIPDIKGLETFQTQAHTSKWPREGFNFQGKRVGVIGTGASGIQVIQDIAGDVKDLVVFQRSPTYALPMRQEKIDAAKKQQSKAVYAHRNTTFSGLEDEFSPQSALEVSDEERERFYEDLWAKGGAGFWLFTYRDTITSPVASDHAYKFWRSKVIQRIENPAAAEILAPEKAPYYFGTKRATLEQSYYEVYNRDNVSLVDTNSNAIAEVTSEGLRVADGTFYQLDVLVLATGFDSVTGGILAIDIKGKDALSLAQKWEGGVQTHLGFATAGFPNLIFHYGPQAPTSFCNGPTCAELQGYWIVKALKYVRDQKRTSLEATRQAETDWAKQVQFIGDQTLLPLTKSEYMGTNIPGKKKEMLNYLGGLPLYIQQINTSLTEGLSGFVLA
ncbi:Baeyer-Villiger monooxygenase [Lachnellula arida]|uniref:Baeyer-Villiger monooxygenase n=1 Tax=Lachnellula arida TaxID=1316785 RepID=A0A8T9B1I8_9HELO|nr:Baeyer-Villiger monooxygenase [Lachnellula arida]